MRRVAALVFLLALHIVPALAVTPDEMLKDPALEARARALSKQLRCMVCQNETIDDSDAPLAHDIRVLVRDRLTRGDSDKQVIDFLVSRYGEFILLRPRFEWRTAVLWGVAPGVLVIGAVTLFVIWRRRPAAAEAAGLDEAERRKLADYLGSGDS
ncbi:MAG: Cytochrome c heme lyase subunit CcmL [Pseudolabrys sp.]|jgi:cytochrome c-type biogenesis protein CcmH|nr:Cytochrome c heme lyase subunit CcmL [Pseudolabrys sp.]